MEWNSYNSWFDINDANISPIDAELWDEEMSVKQKIDEIFDEVIKCVKKPCPCDINLGIELSSLGVWDDEELTRYVIGKYKELFEEICEWFNVPYSDSLADIPDELVKITNILYDRLFLNIDELIHNILARADIRTDNTRTLKKIFNRYVLGYFDKLIDFYDSIYDMASTAKSKNIIMKKRDNCIFVRGVLEATGFTKTMDFIKKIVESMDSYENN
jgi:hypothetical protein